MKAVDIALTQNEHISKFVNITNRYPYTILLRQGRYLVDAKSGARRMQPPEKYAHSA